ncbi:MAG: universal stress protein [Nocardioides sp.]|nr:universal stress protein [Nocardioides sp.]
MTRTIIVGVDDSEAAALAARKAAELATALGAELRVLTAFGKFEAETISTGGEEFFITTADKAEATGQRTVTELHTDFPDVTIKLHASEGKPGEALVKAADQLDADLIVVGNKRVQGIARVLGSIARDVAAHASCDVYVAHTHSK